LDGRGTQLRKRANRRGVGYDQHEVPDAGTEVVRGTKVCPGEEPSKNESQEKKFANERRAQMNSEVQKPSLNRLQLGDGIEPPKKKA